MFENTDLKNHLANSTTILNDSVVIAEWNMNISDNIYKIGNYRYRPTEQGSAYKLLANEFDEDDSGYLYTDATSADTKIDGGLDLEDVPLAFVSKKQKEKLLYSLEDCFYRFRPRSGINKLRYLETANQFVHHTNAEMANRPRYYMSDKNDSFKYWTSYRTETTYKYTFPNGSISYGANPQYSYYDNTGELVFANGAPYSNDERGIATNRLGGGGEFIIDDTAPFIVYWNKMPANRIVVKMQTNVGSVDLGPFGNSSGEIADPFYGFENQTTPIRWKVQYLKDTQWIDAVSFDSNSARFDGTPIIKDDGYVELAYGLVVPEDYRFSFVHAGEYASSFPLPVQASPGYAYLLKDSDTDIGTYHIYVNSTVGYQTFKPKYEWFLSEEAIDNQTRFVTDFTSPPSFIDPTINEPKYREFEYISGLRVVAETMNKFDSTFDLIEMSPRLVSDITSRVSEFSVNKIASDLGISGMPVGQLLASTGSLSIFDYDQSWNPNNNNSIIKDYVSNNLQIKFYDAILDVNGFDYFVPIKTLYSEGFPEADAGSRQVNLKLRDLFFYFESMTAPQIIIKNASISYAVSMVLDSIGFSNYAFKRVPGEKEPIIPYFFIAPDMSVAQVLNELAVSTQSAMFFDEYNNFIMMSKNYIMPTEEERATDITLYGSNDFSDTGILENGKLGTQPLANIIEASSQDNKVYNDGKILYKSRSIERSYGTVQQASVIDQDKTWIYKPVLLWEVSGTENVKSVDGKIDTQSSYALSAIPLNSNLTASVPEVVDFKVINNTMDLGEGVYWLSRYNGYFYANGEMIKYDAVQYSIPGISVIDPNNPNIDGNNVWITSTQEYYNYFSQIPFNGKIYPTGLVRIYCEPNYEKTGDIVQLKNGPVSKHGRGQFGTEIIDHSSGLSDHWSNDANVRGCEMKSEYLFNDSSQSVEITATSSTTTFTTSDVSLVKAGQIVTIYDVAAEDWVSTTKDKIVRVVDVNRVKNESTNLYSFTVTDAPDTALTSKLIRLTTDAMVEVGMAGTVMLKNSSITSKSIAQKATRNGIIRNFLSAQYSNEAVVAGMKTSIPGTIQSSALVLNGPSLATDYVPIDFISYVYKPLSSSFRHFGTRTRIIGKVESTETKSQSPVGSSLYYTATDTTSSNSSITVSGASGGLGVLLNPENNNGYYFEIVALTDNNVESYGSNADIHNILFYKIMKDSTSSQAIPVKLWGGLSQILVDDGRFTGQARVTGEESPTVYDLAVEYEDIGSFRRFYLYINNKIVASVDDESPLDVYNNMAVFVRGASRLMFENVYALSANYSQNSVSVLNTPASSVYDDEEISANESFKKYAMSGIIKSTYLSGISSSEPPKYNLYFEEFGTIMREASYFNIKYDKAYPALYAKLSPTYNRIKGYTVSGFVANAYGAEFLIFNSTDTILNLDSTSGNYLRIQGVTFTAESNNEITVDDYFSKLSDFSNPVYVSESRVISPDVAALQYYDIKSSRTTYGRNQFTLDTAYVQNYDDANDLLGWMVNKIMKPRKSVGLKIFSNPMIQLGDIVSLYMKDNDNVDVLAPEGSRFVVYNIDYSKGTSGPEMTLYLSQVV